MALPGRDHRLRIPIDYVIHDGKIVRRKIPQHVDVMLEQSQIHSSGIVVVQLSQSSFSQQLRDLPHRAGEQKRVIHHDSQVFSCCQIDQLLALRHVAGERLLHENMFPVLERRLRQLIMRPHRSDHCDGIDIRRSEHFRRVGSHTNPRIRLPRARLRSGIQLRNG